MSTNTCNGLLLTSDLMFPSRIVPAARAVGLSLRVSAAPLPPPDAAGWRVVILDLDLPGARPSDLSQRQDFAGAALLAYGPHVDQQRLAEAAAAGFLAIPRSMMSGQAAEVLRRLLDESPRPSAGEESIPDR